MDSTLIPGSKKRIRTGSRWTRAEDAALHYAVLPYVKNNDLSTSEHLTNVQWEKIATSVPGKNRNGEQCKSRWLGVLSQGLIKGPWTEQEDAEVMNAISSGITKWSIIADRIPGRTGKQCRERWYNHLDPSLVHEPFSNTEDTRLLELVEQLGTKWKEVSAAMIGRSENAVKNRWNSLTRRQKGIVRRSVRPRSSTSTPSQTEGGETTTHGTSPKRTRPVSTTTISSTLSNTEEQYDDNDDHDEDDEEEDGDNQDDDNNIDAHHYRNHQQRYIDEVQPSESDNLSDRPDDDDNDITEISGENFSSMVIPSIMMDISSSTNNSPYVGMKMNRQRDSIIPPYPMSVVSQPLYASPNHTLRSTLSTVSNPSSVRLTSTTAASSSSSSSAQPPYGDSMSTTSRISSPAKLDASMDSSNNIKRDLSLLTSGNHYSTVAQYSPGFSSGTASSSSSYVRPTPRYPVQPSSRAASSLAPSSLSTVTPLVIPPPSENIPSDSPPVSPRIMTEAEGANVLLRMLSGDNSTHLSLSIDGTTDPSLATEHKLNNYNGSNYRITGEYLSPVRSSSESTENGTTDQGNHIMVTPNHQYSSVYAYPHTKPSLMIDSSIFPCNTDPNAVLSSSQYLAYHAAIQISPHLSRGPNTTMVSPFHHYDPGTYYGSTQRPLGGTPATHR